jgi:hypothetical protein
MMQSTISIGYNNQGKIYYKLTRDDTNGIHKYKTGLNINQKGIFFTDNTNLYRYVFFFDKIMTNVHEVSIPINAIVKIKKNGWYTTNKLILSQPSSIFNFANSNFWNKAMRHDINVVKYFPFNKICVNMADSICITMLGINKDYIKYIPRKILTYNLCRVILNHDIEYYKILPSRSKGKNYKLNNDEHNEILYKLHFSKSYRKNYVSVSK